MHHRLPLIKRPFLYFLAVVSTVFFLFPFLWMLIVSLKPDPELYNLKAFPSGSRTRPSAISPTVRNTSFLTWTRNSFIVPSPQRRSRWSSYLAAYGLQGFASKALPASPWPSSSPTLSPPRCSFFPSPPSSVSWVVEQLLVTDRHLSFFPDSLLHVLLLGYFRTIPCLGRSAMMDGCNRLQALIHSSFRGIPALSAWIVWIHHVVAGVYLQPYFHFYGKSKDPSAGIVKSSFVAGISFTGAHSWLPASLPPFPVAILYSAFLDYFVAGLTAGAVKS